MNVFRACVTATRRWPCVSFLLFPDLTFLSLPLDSRVDYPLASKVNTIILLRGWVITWSKGHQTISFVRLSWAPTDRIERLSTSHPEPDPPGQVRENPRACEHGRCKTGMGTKNRTQKNGSRAWLFTGLDWTRRYGTASRAYVPRYHSSRRRRMSPDLPCRWKRRVWICMAMCKAIASAISDRIADIRNMYGYYEGTTDTESFCWVWFIRDANNLLEAHLVRWNLNTSWLQAVVILVGPC